MEALNNVRGMLAGVAIMVALGFVGVRLIDGMSPRGDALQQTPGVGIAAAAHRGNASAQYQLGLMYFNGGDGVPQDYVSAHMWFNLSAAQIGELAVTYRRWAELYMMPEQIARAEEMARTCQQSNYKQCGEPSVTDGQTSTPASSIFVYLKKQGGTYVLPVLKNNAITLNFVVDSGAADVTVPADVVWTLTRTGTLNKTDFIGTKTYTLADGSTLPSTTFRIRSLTVGNRVVENVTAGIAPVQGSLLLGQSFLSRFTSWSIDNSRHALVLGE